jgi:hypothetical protein
MLLVSFLTLLAAGTFGAVLAALHLRPGAPRPRAIFGALHGLMGGLGLLGLLVALRGPPRGVAMGAGAFGGIAAALLAVALVVGLAVLMLRRRLSGAIIAVHASIAVAGIVILAAYAFAG